MNLYNTHVLTNPSGLVIMRIIEKPIQQDDEGLHSVGVNISVAEIRKIKGVGQVEANCRQ
jgi:hypothetical protein